MPSRKDKSNQKRNRKVGNEAKPELIQTLAENCDLVTTAELARRVGTKPIDGMTNEEAVAELRRLWPLHGEGATAYCIRRYGAGVRPELWWSDKKRPFVTPRDWNSPDDAVRFASERKRADLEFLRAYKFLSKEESADLDEQGKEKMS
jgi:hypothetical protein